MTTFLNMLSESDKESALLAAVKYGGAQVVSFDPKEFQKIPGSPFAYWVSDRVLAAYKNNKFDDEPNGRGTRCGLGTLDDFRFLRLFWEPSERRDIWVTYFHGGVFSRFYDNFPLVVNWRGSGKEIKAYVEKKVGSASRKVQGEDKYFQPGFVFPRRTKAFSPKFMPRGGIFSTGGQAGFAPQDELAQTVGVLASQVCTFLISLSQGRTGDAAQYEVGLVKRLPWPSHQKFEKKLASLAYEAWSLKRSLDTTEETSSAYLLPEVLRHRLGSFDVKAIKSDLVEIQNQLDEIALNVYALEKEDCVLIDQQISTVESLELEDAVLVDEVSEVDDDYQQAVSETDALLSWAVGVVFGRFDWRLATKERDAPPEPDPFDPLPAKSPGMLPDGAEPFYVHSGILAEELGHHRDLAQLVNEVIARVDVPLKGDVRHWLRRDFFAFHLQRYSKSRRKAPIYWPLTTKSGSYTLWLYYPALTSQTLFTAVNDFIEPKLRQVRGDLDSLRGKGNARSKQEEKRLETATDLAKELADFRDALLAIAPKYSPNHDDGVQITAAPLWQLFRHKPWQKVLNDTWEKLEQGDYDWAHLAMNYWPERVLRKCHQDRDLAIAHDLDGILWHEVGVPVMRGKKPTGETKLEWQPKQLTDDELDALIQEKIKEART